MSWMPSFNLVAQLAHFGWGGFIVTSFALFGMEWFGFLGLFAFAALKEFVFDALIEEQSFQDNALDFGIYLTGGMAALLIVHLASLVSPASLFR